MLQIFPNTYVTETWRKFHDHLTEDYKVGTFHKVGIFHEVGTYYRIFLITMTLKDRENFMTN